MKKKDLMLCLLFVIAVILLPNKTMAAKIEDCDSSYPYACATCIYKTSDGITFTFYAREDKKGNISITDSIRGGNVSNVYEKNDVLDTNYFLGDNATKLTCASELYMKRYNDLNHSSPADNSMKYRFSLSYRKFEGGTYETLTVDPHVNAKVLLKYKNNQDGSTSSDKDNNKIVTRRCIFKADVWNNMQKKVGETEISFEVGDNLPSKTLTGNYSLVFSGFTAKDFGSSDICSVNKTVYVVCNQGSGPSNVGPNTGASSYGAGCTISDTKQSDYFEEVKIENLPTGGHLGGNEILNEAENNSGMPTDFGDEISAKDCQEILGSTLGIINKVFDWIKIIAPILLIVFGSIDFAGAVIQNDNDALKKATNKFIKRAIAAVAVFFLPFIINLILGLPGVDSGLEEALCGIGKVIIK